MLKTALKGVFTALCLLSMNLVYGQLAYVANNASNDVAVVDLSTGTVVTSIALQGGPVKIAVAPDGSQISAAGLNFVSFLNPADNSVISEVTNGTEVREVLYSPDGSTVYTVDQLTTLIQPFDAATQAEGTFGFLLSGTGPLAGAFDPATGNLLVVNNGSGDLANFTVGPLTQQLPNIAVGQAPQDIVFDPSGNTAYVPNFNNNNVSVVDIAAGTSTTIDGFDSPIAAEITPDASTLFVINDGDNTIAVVDLASGTITSTITVGAEPRGLAVSEDGSTLVVTNSADDNISVVDVATATVTATIDNVGDSPVSVVIIAGGDTGGPDLQEAIDEVVSNQTITSVSGLNFGGVSTGVITADGTVFTSVDGVSIPGVDLTADQRLGASEFTQTVLATLAIALVEEGALTLDQTVSDLIDVATLTNIPGDRTIEQLLNHTSGYANFATADNYQSTVLFDATRAFTPEEITDLFVGAPSDAGTFAYSNTNFLVLGLVLDAANGTESLQESLTRLVLTPAGLTTTEIYAGTDPADLAPLFADVFGTGFPNQLSPNTSVLTGASTAGNLLATPAEMVQFIQAVETGSVISEAGVEQLLTFAPSTDRIGSGYGLGIEEFEVEIAGTATTVVGHTGGVNYVSTLLYSPLADVGAYVVTSNGVASEQQVFDLALELLNVSIDSIPMDTVPPPAFDTAFVQVVHNAADPGAEVVDIYVVDGADTTLLDDVAFRTATPFLPLPAGTDLEVVVAGPDSESAADGLATFTFNLAADSSYYLVANGVLDTAGFAPNPEGLDIAFNLFAFEGARQEGVTDTLVDVNVFHGSTDAPNVGVNANGGVIIPGFSYGDFSGYLSVPAQPYTLDVTAGGDSSAVLFSFEADLTGTEGAAALVLASGFVDTAANAGGAGFGLLAVFADGTAALLPEVMDTVPPPAFDTAFVQVVHNAADPGAEVVDIYVVDGADTTLLDDVAFRTATPFLPLPAGTDLEVVVAGPDSESAADGLATFTFNLAADSSYYLVANGVLDTAGFAPNPEGLDIAFNLFAFEGARQEGVTDTLVDVNVFHGSTDAPNVGVNANGGVIIPGFSYGDFSGYLSVPAQPYTLDVTAGGDSSAVLFSFEADLTGTEGAAALVLASGFVDTAANAGGAGFGLLAVFADGTAALLPEVMDTVPPPVDTGAFTLQILHANDLEGGRDAIENAPNFAAIVDSLEGEFDNTLILSGGDNYIPGPFFNAAGDFSLRPVFQDVYQTFFNEPGLTNLREAPGRADITIMNIIGFDASAVGNHEFDAGTDAYADIIGTDIRGAALSDVRWLGAQFPYLSANLDFSGDGSLAGLATTDILDNTEFQSTPDDLDAAAAAPKLAPATTIERGGQTIGVVGATTQLLETITSNGGVTETSSPGVDDMPALAAVIQPVIDGFTAEGINKVILVSHLQNIDNEKELVTLLSGIDVVVAGGSDVLMAQDDDILRPGDTPAEPYPFIAADADGNPAVVLGTDGEYTYVGRLVVEFDSAGVIDTASLADAINGAYATDEDGVGRVWGSDDPFVEASKGELVSRLTDAISDFVAELDSIIVGRTDVFIEGRRDAVRTEETNLGNLTADANLDLAQSFDSTVVISLKNGGGIRAAIGTTDSLGNLLPPPANPEVGKEEGDVSALDVVNSLRFNNGLSLLTLTAEELQEVLEHAFAASSEDPGNQPGRFPQVGGISVLVDLARDPGSRVGEAFLIDADGNATDTIIASGQLVVDPASTYRIVTLDFLAGGGDSYPYPDFDSVSLNQINLDTVLTEDGDFTFAPAGSEQDALAEFMFTNFFDTPFADAETPRDEDTRIRFGEFQDEGTEEALQEILDNSTITEVVPGLSFGGITASVVTSTGEQFDLATGNSTPAEEMAAELRLGASEVSQTVAAALTLALMEEGALMLSQTVGDYIDVSGLTNVPAEITIQQLLSHTSGLDDFGSDEDYKSTILFDVNREFTAEEITDLFVDVPTEAGAFSYSNTNFLVLGLVLEAANGDETLQESFDRLISTPAGITGLEIYQNTGDPADSLTFGDPADLAPLFADVFGTGFPQQVRPHTSVFSGAGAAGDLIGSSASFLAILEGLADGAIISDSNFMRMTDFVDIDGRLSDAYGLGIEEFNLNVNGVELPFIGHVGSINYVTVALYNAETGAGVHLATNNGVVSEADALELARQLLQVATGVANDTATAVAQIIHNSADPAAAVVDIYVVDGESVTKLDDVAFRTATGFLTLPAARQIEVVVAGPDSESEADGIATFPVTLEADKSYYVTAAGVLDPTAFAANPDGESTAFNLFVTEGARQEAEDPELVDLNVFHGATDVVAVGVLADGAELIGSTTYGSYSGFVSVPPAEYRLDLTSRGLPSAVIDSFIADLSEAAGLAGLVVASGFNNPDANQGGEPFGLFLALPTGGELIELPRPEGDTIVPDTSAFQVLDGDNNIVVDALNDGGVIDLAETGDIPLNIRLNPAVVGEVGSVIFDLDGPISLTRTENAAPYFVFGDDATTGRNFARNLPIGSYNLVATIYAGAGGSGEIISTEVINFEVVNDDAPTVNAFQVVDRDGNIVIENLTDGAVIDLAETGDIPLNIEILLNVEEVGSVNIQFDGPLSRSGQENLAPYFALGDDPETGRNFAQNLPVGSYTLTATPFDGPGSTGAEGNPLTVNFTVVDNSNGLVEITQPSASVLVSSELSLDVFPNPAINNATLVVEGDVEGMLRTYIANAAGSIVKEFNFAKDKGVNNYNLDLSNLPTGMYILRTVIGDHTNVTRLMVRNN